MKKVFNKLTKILLVISIMISQLAPSIMVFAEEGVSLKVSVSSDDTTYTDLSNNDNYTFDQSVAIPNYYYKLDGDGFTDTDKYLIKEVVDFYGDWDLETKVSTNSYLRYATGLELNNIISYSNLYDKINNKNGYYEFNISTYKLSDISIGGSTLDTKTQLELDALESQILALDMTNYTKVTSNNFTNTVTNLSSGFVLESIKDDSFIDLNSVEDIYQFDASLNNGFTMKFHYDVASMNDNDVYHINIYSNDVLINAINDSETNTLKLPQDLDVIELVNGIHTYKIQLFDSNDNLINNKTIQINVVNSLINNDLVSYYTLDDTMRNNYNLLIKKLCNYKLITDEEKLLLDDSIKEEMDKYAEELEKEHNDFLFNNNIFSPYNVVVDSFYEINNTKNNVLYGFDGIFNKAGINVPTNVLVGDLKNIVDSSYVVPHMINGTLFENKNVKAKVYDKDGNEVLDTDYIQTGMRLAINYFSIIQEYVLVVKGNIVSDDGMINTEDIREGINLGINASSLDNNYYKAADVNDDKSVDILDITEINYILNNNNGDDSFTLFTNNTVAPVISDSVLVSIESNKDSIRVGDNFEISLIVKGLVNNKINGIEGILNYDKNLIKCNSIDVYKDWFGNINVINDINNGKFMYTGNTEVSTDISILTFKFEALAIGDAKIKIDNLKAALNGYEITLVNTNKETNEISVEILRALSGNANISELSFNKGWLKTAFDKNTLNHTLYVDYRVDSIKLGGVLEDSNAKTDAFKEYNLNNYRTVIPITVVAENGNIKTYTVEVIKVDTRSSNNYLKELKIKDVELTFDKNILEYEFSVLYDVTELDITAIASDDDATVIISGDTKLKVGENEITIKVVAENGKEKEYTLKVTRKEKEKEEEVIEKEEKEDNGSKLLLIILILATICGLIYLVFKDGEDNKKIKGNIKPNIKK